MLDFYDPGALKVKFGDWVVAETARGQELGRVVEPPKLRGSQEYATFKLLRLATDDDFLKHRHNELQAQASLPIIRERIAAFNLPMKVLGTFITLDKNRIIIEFAAESRVDFRALVHDLASRLRKRIELHQISVRDRSIFTGGLGICGREICCASWIRDFDAVLINMAKVQGLSLSPNKISGSCGRLMCCLKFELESYEEFQRSLPQVGDRVEYEGRTLEVLTLNMTRDSVTLGENENTTIELPAAVVRTLHCESGPRTNDDNDMSSWSDFCEELEPDSDTLLPRESGERMAPPKTGAARSRQTGVARSRQTATKPPLARQQGRQRARHTANKPNTATPSSPNNLRKTQNKPH